MLFLEQWLVLGLLVQLTAVIKTVHGKERVYAGIHDMPNAARELVDKNGNVMALARAARAHDSDDLVVAVNRRLRQRTVTRRADGHGRVGVAYVAAHGAATKVALFLGLKDVSHGSGPRPSAKRRVLLVHLGSRPRRAGVALAICAAILYGIGPELLKAKRAHNAARREGRYARRRSSRSE